MPNHHGKSDKGGEKHRARHKKHESSSSSSETEEEKVVTVVKKVVNRSRRSSRSRSRSCSRSSSSSRSRSRSCTPDKKHKKESHHKKDRSRSRSRSCSPPKKEEKCALKLLGCEEKRERRRTRRGRHSGDRSDSDCSDSDRSCSDHDKSCSDAESCSDQEYDRDKWCDEDKWYCYMKKKLLKDPSLLAAGSDAFGSFYCTTEQKVALSAPIIWENEQIAYNIDRGSSSGSIYVRKDGVYYFAFSVSPAVASQWSLFVNADLVMTKGIASGAGQMLMFKILELKANDTLSLRNYTSGVGEVSLAVDIGGSTPGTNAEIVIRKIGPPQVLDRYTKPKKVRISHKAKRLFECIEKKMACDPELMINGSSSYGAYWSVLMQNVPLEAAVTFENHQNLKCQEHVLGSGQVCVKENGIYTFAFLAEPDKPSQFTFFINGAPVTSTTQGSNKGASFLMLRQQLELKAGDKVEVRNHISTAGTVTLTPTPGGSAMGQSALLLIYKIAPAKCDLQPPVSLECWCNEKMVQKNKLAKELAGNISDSDLEEDRQRIRCSPYKLFKNFLLSRPRVDIDGVSAYVHSVKTLAQSMQIGDAITLRTAIPPKNACHVTGTAPFRVRKAGIYEIVFDTQTVQPGQFSVFNKESVELSAISGSNSGANEIVVSQLLCLDRDDVLTVRNWKSFVNPVLMQVNPGGLEIGENSTFTILRIGPARCKKDKCDPKDKK